MQIECKLVRKGGTFVEIDGQTYHFAANERGKFVAEVADEAHIAKLLSITDGYQVYGNSVAPSGVESVGKMKDPEERTSDDPAHKAAVEAFIAKFGREPEADMATKTILAVIKKG